MTPFVLESDMTLFCDIDETLVTYASGITDPEELSECVYINGHGFKPLHKNIEYLYEASARNHKIVFWSAGGYQWATEVVKALDLTHIASAILSKPRWFMDDLPASEFMPEHIRIYKEE